MRVRVQRDAKERRELDVTLRVLAAEPQQCAERRAVVGAARDPAADIVKLAIKEWKSGYGAQPVFLGPCLGLGTAGPTGRRGPAPPTAVRT